MSSFRPKTRSFTKSADVKLPANSDKWRDSIFEIVSKIHPYLAPYLSGDIDWGVDPIDYQEGSGIGSITALIGDNPIQIPIIVRDGKLKDVDLYLTKDGDMNLLTKKVILENPDFKTVDLGQKIPFSEALQSSRGMGGSFYSKIASYPNFSDDLKRMRGHVTSDFPELEDSFARIEKRAGKSSQAFDTLSIQNEDGFYKVSAFRQGHHLDRFELSKAAAFMDPDSQIAEMARRARRGSAMFSHRDLVKEAVALDDRTSNPESISMGLECGDSVIVPSEKGAGIDNIRGKIYNVGTFDAILRPSDSTFKMVLGENGAWASPLPEGAKKGSSFTPTLIDHKELRRGDSYFMVYFDKAIGPLQFTGMFRKPGDDTIYLFQSQAEGAIKAYFSESTKEPFELGGELANTSEFLLPTSMKFFEMREEMVPVPVHMSLAKIAEKSFQENTTSVEILFDGESYLCKYAGLGQAIDYRLSEVETVAWLSSLGVTQDSAQEVVKVAHESNTKVMAYGVEYPYDANHGDELLPWEKRAQIDALIDVWADNRNQISKLAAAINPFVKKEEEEKKEKEEEEEVPAEGEENESPGAIADDMESIKAEGEEAQAQEGGEEEVPEEEGEAEAEEEAEGPNPFLPGSPLPSPPPGPEEAPPSGEEMGGPEEISAETGNAQMEGMAPGNENLGSASDLQDNLNSVNLMNQYNASKFSEATPEIEQTKKSVANLLYRVRSGDIEEVDEEVVKDGLRSLDSILASLYEVSAGKSE